MDTRAALVKMAGLPAYLKGIDRARSAVWKDVDLLRQRSRVLGEVGPGSWLDKRLASADPFHKSYGGYPQTLGPLEDAQTGRETAERLAGIRAKKGEDVYRRHQASEREYWPQKGEAPQAPTSAVERLRALPPEERARRLSTYKQDAFSRSRKAADAQALAELAS